RRSGGECGLAAVCDGALGGAGLRPRLLAVRVLRRVARHHAADAAADGIHEPPADADRGPRDGRVPGGVLPLSRRCQSSERHRRRLHPRRVASPLSAAMLDNLLLGLTAALQWKQFLFMIVGTVIGLWVGVLPGLGGPVAMAILIPFTFSMDPLSALLMLASISVGAAFGGSITSILLNIPGEASSAATAYDGYPMAQQGKAKVAMGLSAGASMVAGIVGVIILMFAS